MPFVELTLPEGALAVAEAQVLVRDLGRALLESEGVAADRHATAMLRGLVDLRPAHHVLRDGAIAGRPLYRVTYTVMRGGLDDRGRAGLVEVATSLVLRAEGIDEPDVRDRARVWVVIDEIEDGNWGAAGSVVRIADAATLVTPALREGA